MDWKEFLKPDLRKIVLWLILFIFSSFVIYLISFYEKTHAAIPEAFVFERWGFPFMFAFEFDTISIIYKNLFLDLIFWYLLSCLIVWIYDKYRGKKR